MSINNTFNITDFGAISDGATDCTKQIQDALNAAGKVKGTVIVPPGKFLCGYVRVPAYITVKGDYAWDFGLTQGGSILELNDPTAKCMLDVTGAFGSCISGLSVNGNALGNGIHGIMLEWNDRYKDRKDLGGKEDTLTITDCRIGHFSGNAVHLQNVWCFSIRHSMLCYSENGLFINGCDGFILDNWFSCNRKSGIAGNTFMSGTFTGNRIECNYECGAEFYNIGVVQFNNNYFDYNNFCGFYSADTGEDFRGNISFTGNIFHIDGLLSFDKNATKKSQSHIDIRHAVNILITGNSFIGGSIGSHKGPKYSITYSQLKSSVISNNTMQNGAVENNLNDLGNHKAEVIVFNNAGYDGILSESKNDWPRFDD